LGGDYDNEYWCLETGRPDADMKEDIINAIIMGIIWRVRDTLRREKL
jgi:hypothetical protein